MTNNKNHISTACLIAASFLAACGSSSGPIVTDEPDYIYLLIEGQSNSTSRGHDGGATNFEPCECVENWDNLTGEWVKSTLFSLGPLFDMTVPDTTTERNNYGQSAAKAISLHYDRPVRFITNGRGGAFIDMWINGKEGNRFELTRDIVIASGADEVISLWHQGERNRDDTPEEYTAKMDAYEELLFAQEWHSGLIVYGELFDAVGDREPPTDFQNPQIRKREHVASSEGLTSRDNLHFDSLSKEILGERYANEVISSEYGMTLYKDSHDR